MKDRKRVLQFIIGILLVMFIGVALYLRIGLAYDRVFSGDIVKFAGYDSWYYLRLVDNLLHHFPKIITFDPYTSFPHGMNVFWHPFYTFLIGSIALLVGLGSPAQHLIDTVASYIPPVLGALTVIPVFYIGKELFNRWAGVIAALLIAVMPGEFLGRSMLGFTDHHVAETLFITVSLLFLMKAIKWSKQSQLSFNHIKNPDWSIIKKPLIFTILGSIFLSFYVLSWVAGVMFIFIIFVYIVVQFILDHLRGETTGYLATVNTIFFLIVFIIILPFVVGSHYNILYLVSLPIAILIPPVLWYVSRIMLKYTSKNWLFPILIVIAGLIGIALFYLVNPSLVKYALNQFNVFNPSGAVLTITEVQPLLFQRGQFNLALTFYNFGTGFILSIISLLILIYGIIKHNDQGKAMFIVWTILVIIATLGQRRFAYYLAVNVAISSGCLAWLTIQVLGLDRKTVALAKTYKDKKQKKEKQKYKQDQQSPSTIKPAGFALAVILVAVVIVYPTIASPPRIGPLGEGGLLAVHRVKNARFIDDALFNTLTWLKDNTPDPFDNPEFYYDLYKSPPPSTDYNYPDTAYGVMSLWDYGHMITRIAHRIPVSNPHQFGARITAKYFTEQNELLANSIADDLGVRYVIVDNDMATVTLHGSIITYASKNTRDFFEIYYRPENGKLRGDYYFYPEYYASMVSRLYNFDGDSVIPHETTLIRYQEKTFPEGDRYKEIVEILKFPDYGAALDHAQKLNTPMYKIVGTDPFVSPIPLEPLENYKLIYSSKEYTTNPGVGNISLVKVFEYTSPKE